MFLSSLNTHDFLALLSSTKINENSLVEREKIMIKIIQENLIRIKMIKSKPKKFVIGYQI